MKNFTFFFLLTIILQAEVTFNEHIAPIIHENCSGCHRPGQSGPFSLITYKDVRKRSRTIDEVLLDRYMPPWKPVNGNIHFANERRLTDKEIALFSEWVESETPEGDPNKKPQTPEFPSTWYLGKPDMVITMKGTFEVPAEGRDIYRSFVFPLQLPDDKWVKAVELRPKAKSSVHHALFFVDPSGQARKDDGNDGKAGFRGMSFLRSQFLGVGNPVRGAFGGSNDLGSHVPGATPAKLPGDLAMFLPKGSDIVMQTHFHPSGKKEVEQAELALYFTDKAPEKNLVQIQIPPVFGRTARIDIPAGEKNYIVKDSMTVPVPVEAVLVGGHAHYICRTMTMTATLPDGKVLTLMDIQDWDLDWQDRYQFKKPISLPAGTVLKSRITYDNSAGNSENPFSPPQRIKWGQESTDEMGSITLTVIPKAKVDAPILAKAQRDHLVQSFARNMVPNNGNVEVKGYDTNGDGLIKENEVSSRFRNRIFKRYDKDGDKILNKEEQAELQKGLSALRSLMKR